MIIQLQKDAIKAAELSVVTAIVGVELLLFLAVTWFILS